MSQSVVTTGVHQGTTAAKPHPLQIATESLTVNTQERVELVNLTPQLVERVRSSGIRSGIVLINSLHTTLALFINEWQEALLDDIRSFLDQVVVRGNYWKHNDPRFSDCDRMNADAHLRAMLLGHNLILQVQNGELVLGQYQSVILAELDGPRERGLQLQILGTA